MTCFSFDACVLVLAIVAAGCGGEKDGGSDASGGDATSAATGSPTDGASGQGPDVDDLPAAADVCAAACATIKMCTGGTESCEDDCLAGIEFMTTNNPGTDCGGYELGRQDCLSRLTCDQLDAYSDGVDDPMRPCKPWLDAEAGCAIE